MYLDMIMDHWSKRHRNIPMYFVEKYNFKDCCYDNRVVVVVVIIHNNNSNNHIRIRKQMPKRDNNNNRNDAPED